MYKYALYTSSILVAIQKSAVFYSRYGIIFPIKNMDIFSKFQLKISQSKVYTIYWRYVYFPILKLTMSKFPIKLERVKIPKRWKNLYVTIRTCVLHSHRPTTGCCASHVSTKPHHWLKVRHPRGHLEGQRATDDLHAHRDLGVLQVSNL